MKNLIYNEFCMCFNKKNLKVLLLILGYISLEVYSLYSINLVNSLKAIDTDGLLKVCSGINEPFSILNIMKWLFLIVILTFICLNNISIISGFDMMVLSRSGSRGKWWICKITSLIIINTCYALFIVIVSKVLFFGVFKSGNQWSKFTDIYYKNVFIANISPRKFEIIIFFMLLTGFIALTTLFQTINIIFNNNPRVYVVLIILSIGLSRLYINGVIPRVLSPFNYPSVLDIVSKNHGYIKGFLSNIILTIINVLVSLMLVTNKDFKISQD